MEIAKEEGQDVNLNLEVLNNVLNMYKELARNQMDELGTQALIKYMRNSCIQKRAIDRYGL